MIMHRLHEDDLAGHVLTQEAWETVRLPAIADEDEVHQAETVFGRHATGQNACASDVRDWCGRPESNRHRPCGPTDFRTPTAFTARSGAFRAGEVRGLDYPFTLAVRL